MDWTIEDGCFGFCTTYKFHCVDIIVTANAFRCLLLNYSNGICTTFFNCVYAHRYEYTYGHCYNVESRISLKTDYYLSCCAALGTWLDSLIHKRKVVTSKKAQSKANVSWLTVVLHEKPAPVSSYPSCKMYIVLLIIFSRRFGGVTYIVQANEKKKMT